MFKLIAQLCFIILPLLGHAETFSAGKDYEIIAQNTDKPNNKTVIVQEFFSYGCPWCFKIDNTIQSWVKNKSNKIKFQKIPMVFHKEWEPYAKAYYLSQALGKNNELNDLLFKAIMVEKQKLDTNSSMANFLATQGIDKNIAESALNNSASIDVQIQEGLKMMAQYRVNAIPAFVVGGQYKTDLQMAGTEARLVAILDELVKKSR